MAQLIPDTVALNTIAGVTTFLGFAGIIAYLYFTVQAKEVEQSIGSLIGQERHFSAKQVIQVLAKIKGAEQQIRALEILTNYTEKESRTFLREVTGSVDLARLGRIKSKQYRDGLIIGAVFFLLLAGLAFASTIIPRPPIRTQPSPDHGKEPARKSSRESTETPGLPASSESRGQPPGSPGPDPAKVQAAAYYSKAKHAWAAGLVDVAVEECNKAAQSDSIYSKNANCQHYWNYQKIAEQKEASDAK